MIGIVSDSHGQLTNTQRAVEVLRTQNVELVIHCGDIGSAAVVELFKPWPAHFVFGNVDHQPEQLAAVIEAAGLHSHGRFGSIDHHSRRIAFLHGDDQRRLVQTVESGEWDLVCYGHTHRPEVRRAGNTLVVNPGALFRARPHTLAVIDPATLTAQILPLAATSV